MGMSEVKLFCPGLIFTGGKAWCQLTNKEVVIDGGLDPNTSPYCPVRKSVNDYCETSEDNVEKIIKPLILKKARVSLSQKK